MDASDAVWSGRETPVAGVSWESWKTWDGWDGWETCGATTRALTSIGVPGGEYLVALDKRLSMTWQDWAGLDKEDVR